MLGATLSCAPPVRETPPLDPATSYVFLAWERSGQLQLERLDTESRVRATDADPSSLYLITLSKSAATAAHRLIDPDRDAEVRLSTHAREELLACEARGVLSGTTPNAQSLRFPPSSLGAELQVLEDDAWVSRDWPTTGRLSELAVELPIRNPCLLRRWRAEPFFAESPLLKPGVTVRDLTLSEQRPNGLTIIGLTPLSDGSYLLPTTQLLGVARAGGPLLPDASWPISELPPPPVEWSDGASALLGWRLSALWEAGTSTAGANRFLLRMTAHEFDGREDGDILGTRLVEVRYAGGRIRVARLLHSAGRFDAEAVTEAMPFGDEGGFLAVGPSYLMLKRRFDAPLERWPRQWSPRTLARLDLPNAKYFIGLEDGGVMLGDVEQGFEGLRQESPGPGTRRCTRAALLQRDGERRLIVVCSGSAIYVRERDGWRRMYPWLPEEPSCVHDTRQCGRPTFGVTNLFEGLVPSLEGGLWASRRGCPVSFSFGLDEESCAIAEDWDLAGLRYPSLSTEPNEIVWWGRTPEGIAVAGYGGLAARTRRWSRRRCRSRPRSPRSLRKRGRARRWRRQGGFGGGSSWAPC